MHKIKLFFALLSVSFLTACGGGSSGGNDNNEVDFSGVWNEKTTYNVCPGKEINLTLEMLSFNITGFIDTVNYYPGTVINISDCSYHEFSFYTVETPNLINPASDTVFKWWLEDMYSNREDTELTITNFESNNVSYQVKYIINGYIVIESTTLTR